MYLHILYILHIFICKEIIMTINVNNFLFKIYKVIFDILSNYLTISH